MPLSYVIAQPSCLFFFTVTFWYCSEILCDGYVIANERWSRKNCDRNAWGKSQTIAHEKNELDWKADLSIKSDKIAQHISAFANHPGGGFFVFGVNNDGIPVGVRNLDYSEIVKRLGNIARDGVVSSVAIDHSILSYEGKELLFVYVPESFDKLVYPRSGTVYDSYTRSAGQTRKMSRSEVGRLIATSNGGSFETESASQAL